MVGMIRQYRRLILVLLVLASGGLLTIWYFSPHTFVSKVTLPGGEPITVFQHASWGWYVKEVSVDARGKEFLVRQWSRKRIPLFRRSHLWTTAADEEYYFKVPGEPHWSKAVIRVDARLEVVIEDPKQEGTPEKCFCQENKTFE